MSAQLHIIADLDVCLVEPKEWPYALLDAVCVQVWPEQVAMLPEERVIKQW